MSKQHFEIGLSLIVVFGPLSVPRAVVECTKQYISTI